MSTTKTNWRTDREQYTRSNATTARLLTLAALVKSFASGFRCGAYQGKVPFTSYYDRGVNCRLTSPYGHLSITDSSFGPRNANIPYLYNTGTSVTRTLGSVPLVFVLKSFDCMPCWGEPKTLGAQNVWLMSVLKRNKH